MGENDHGVFAAQAVSGESASRGASQPPGLLVGVATRQEGA